LRVKFEEPEIVISRFAAEDVMTTSGGLTDGGAGDNGGGNFGDLFG